MEINEEREKLIKKLKEFFQQNAENFKLSLALLFGSWAQGSPRRDSDVDIAVFFEEGKIDKEEKKALVRKITALLEERIKREVSILIIDPALSKPMVYYNALVSGIPLYVSDSSLLHHLRMDAIHEMEDFSSRGLKWQMELAGRYLKGK